MSVWLQMACHDQMCGGWALMKKIGFDTHYSYPASAKEIDVIR